MRRGTYWGTYGPEYASELRQIHGTASTAAPPGGGAAEGAPPPKVHLPFEEEPARAAPRRAPRRARARGGARAQRWSNEQPRGSDKALSPLQLQSNGRPSDAAPPTSPKLLPVVVRAVPAPSENSQRGRSAARLGYVVPAWVSGNSDSPPPLPPRQHLGAEGRAPRSGVRGRSLKKAGGRRTTVAVHARGEPRAPSATPVEEVYTSAWGNVGYLGAHSRTGPPETWFQPPPHRM